jgi:hypothetical protein
MKVDEQMKKYPDGGIWDGSSCIGFVVLTRVVLKSSILWDITLSSPQKVN